MTWLALGALLRKYPGSGGQPIQSQNTRRIDMRSLQYNLLTPVGDGQTPVYGYLLDFLQAIPHLLSGGLIPPLVVLNHIFKMGVYDAGMSGGITWEPFEIDQTEFNELVDVFISLKDAEYQLAVTPE
jgi:hypothetical protein